MLIRRKGGVTALLHIDEVTWHFQVTSGSLDLATEASGGLVHFRAFLSPARFLAFALTPAEARKYAARIVKAADAAEKGAS